MIIVKSYYGQLSSNTMCLCVCSVSSVFKNEKFCLKKLNKRKHDIKSATYDAGLLHILDS